MSCVTAQIMILDHPGVQSSDFNSCVVYKYLGCHLYFDDANVRIGHCLKVFDSRQDMRAGCLPMLIIMVNMIRRGHISAIMHTKQHHARALYVPW